MAKTGTCKYFRFTSLQITETLDEAVQMCNAMQTHQIIYHVDGKQVPFEKGQQLFRFTDPTWFEKEKEKFTNAVSITESWHSCLSKLKDHESLEGEMLELSLQGRSDLVEKHHLTEPKNYESLPTMSFDVHNCDLYD